MKRLILEILENNSRISVEDLAAMLGKTPEDIMEAMAEMEEENIICGYSTLINWDKTDREYVTAMIEVKVTPQRDRGFDKIAERIYGFDEVKSVYLMSGGFDLLVMMEGKKKFLSLSLISFLHLIQFLVQQLTSYLKNTRTMV